MRLVTCLILLVVAYAAPPKVVNIDPKSIKVLISGNQRPNSTYYNFGFLQTDGSQRAETGFLESEAKTEKPVIRGSYSWVAPEGIYYVVEYYADETGFHPTIKQMGPFAKPNAPNEEEGQGDIPPAVLASLLGG